jgi:hypothetical protein
MIPHDLVNDSSSRMMTMFPLIARGVRSKLNYSWRIKNIRERSRDRFIERASASRLERKRRNEQENIPRDKLGIIMCLGNAQFSRLIIDIRFTAHRCPTVRLWWFFQRSTRAGGPTRHTLRHPIIICTQVILSMIMSVIVLAMSVCSFAFLVIQYAALDVARLALKVLVW